MLRHVGVFRRLLSRSLCWLAICLLGVFWVGCPSQQVVTKPKLQQPPPRTRVAKPTPPRSPLRTQYRFPARVALAPARGPRHAPLQVVELLNPTSPTSMQIQALRAMVWKRFPGSVRWTIRMNPSLGADRGYYYARALQAARRTGIFWPYLKRFYQARSPSFKKLLAMADASGVDAQLFELNLAYAPRKMIIDRDMRWALGFGLQGKAGLFINGAWLPPPYTKERLFKALTLTQQRASAMLRQGTELTKLYDAFCAKGKPAPQARQIPRAIGARRYINVPHAYLEGVPTRGPGDAVVHIVEFSDFTCIPCRKAYLWLHALLQKHPKKLRFSFKFYPIGIHKESYRAAQLAAAAQDRRKFWKLYDLLFREQRRLLQGDLLELAKEAGLDAQWIAGELDRGSYKRRVSINKGHGRRMGIRAVPTILIDGLFVPGFRSAKDLLRLVHIEMWKAGDPSGMNATR